MVNGLHMLRGGAPVSEMAAAQVSWLKSLFLRLLGRYMVPAEPFREAFFRERAISVCLGAGIPLSAVCLVGGVQSLRTVLEAVDPQRGSGFGAVQMGRVLLADPDFCVKVGLSSADKLLTDSASSLTSSSVVNQSVNICDNSNRCIVESTMAMKPLSCKKYPRKWSSTLPSAVSKNVNKDSSCHRNEADSCGTWVQGW
jgi:hypothetical protein